MRNLANVTYVPVDRAVINEAADLAADWGLRGMDGIYVAVARRFGFTLVTLDADARQRAAHVVRAFTPADAVTSLAP